MKKDPGKSAHWRLSWVSSGLFDSLIDVISELQDEHLQIST